MEATPVNQDGAIPAGRAVPPVDMPSMDRPSAAPSREGDAACIMALKWQALHEAASAVAAMAGIESEPMSPEQRDFPAMMRKAGGRRLATAQQGVEDIAAIMEPGLSALLAAHAGGADAPAAALALWEEFQGARDAVMALLPA